MSLNDRAIEDLKRISSNADEFGTEIILTAPDDSTVTINGLQTLHHTGFDLDGVRVNSKISSVGISTELLGDYPYIDADGEVNFSNHKVTTGGNDYIVREFYPDEKLKFTTLILSAWQA